MSAWKEKLAKIAKEKFGMTIDQRQDSTEADRSHEVQLNHIKHISPGRQANAPYNFIPLNKTIIQSEQRPDFDVYHCKEDNMRNTGCISLEIETRTPLYIRDTLTEGEMQEEKVIEKENREKGTKKKYINPDFFSPGDKIRIPGSSLRGMAKTMVEIVSWSKIQFVNNNRFFYRALADRDLDLRKEYQGKMASAFPNVIPKAKAGYIIKVPGEMACKIKPAKPLKNFGNATYFRIDQNIVSKTFSDVVSMQDNNYKMKRVEVFFKPTNPDSIPKYHDDHHGDLKMWYGKISHELKSVDNPPPDTEDGWEMGWLICSGGMHNKKMHYIITEADDVRDDQLIPINQELIAAYKDTLSKAIKENNMNVLPEKDNGNNGKPVPCFYIEENGQVIAFGHTPFFRFPYDSKVSGMIRQNTLNKAKFDIAETIFGNERDFASRVFFEDADVCFKEGQTKQNIFLEKRPPKILSTPKPTTYNHYLVQDNEGEPVFKKIYRNDFERIIKRFNDTDSDWLEKFVSGYKGIKQWDSDNTAIRGHKLYWHRSGKDWIDDKVQDYSECDEQHTIIRPIKNGVTFKGRIRFENLSDVELGALLFALDLPPGCCHKLGMGKPLGLGSVQIIPKLFLSDRKARYKELFAEWGVNETSAGKDIPHFKKTFAEYILKEIGKNAGADPINTLWEVDRMKELKAMLDFDKKPADEKTRYMELGDFKERKVLPVPTDVVQ
ncbi:MAG: TIGR03986 family CRISPR-associated RAMP protein [Candidatus Brocadia sp.]